MKTLKVFIALLLILLGGCNNPGPTEPNAPPEPVVIVTVPFIEVTTTATTADIKSTINTNGAVNNISIEYGIGNYVNTTNAVPNTFNVATTVNTKLTELVPNTKYQFRIKAVTGTKNVVKYIADSSFTTNSQLKLGDSYKKGVVIEVHITNGVQHGLLAAPFDQSDSTKGLAYAEALEACKNYAEGYHLPDSTELKIVKNAFDHGILYGIVKIGVTIYLSSTISLNPNWIFCLNFKNGEMGLINKLSRANARAVCSF